MEKYTPCTSGLTEAEATFQKNFYLGGAHPNGQDVAFWRALNSNNVQICSSTYPRTSTWYNLLGLFHNDVLEAWSETCKSSSAGACSKAANACKSKETASKPVAAAADDDDDDLFGDNDDDEAAEKAAAALKAKNDAKKAGGKKEKEPVIAKSLVLIDVKVYEIETDLNALAAKILAEVSMDGLVWKTEYRIEEVAFGIKKLVMGMTIEDEKVSVDDIQEQLQEWEEIQNVDIAAFNKI